MPATSKDELLAVTEKEYAKLAKLLGEVDLKTAMKKRAESTSLKDIVGHRAHWIALFLGWYKDGMAGKEVCFPAPGYKWNQLKEYNKALRQKQSDLSWEDAKQQLQSNHLKLLRFIKSHTDQELYGAAMAGAKNNWTTGRWAEAAGPSHYRSAAKFFRECLRNDG